MFLLIIKQKPANKDRSKQTLQRERMNGSY